MEASNEIRETLIRGSGNPALVLYLGTLSRMAFDAGIYSSLDDDHWRGLFAA